MNSAQEILSIKKQASPILKKYGVRKAAIFGSYARGEAKAKSDVDFLIDIKPITFTAFFELKEQLEKTLGKDIDLVTARALHPFIRDRVMKEKILIYGPAF